MWNFRTPRSLFAQNYQLSRPGIPQNLLRKILEAPASREVFRRAWEMYKSPLEIDPLMTLECFRYLLEIGGRPKSWINAKIFKCFVGLNPCTAHLEKMCLLEEFGVELEFPVWRLQSRPMMAWAMLSAGHLASSNIPDDFRPIDDQLLARRPHTRVFFSKELKTRALFIYWTLRQLNVHKNIRSYIVAHVIEMELAEKRGNPNFVYGL